MTTKHLTLAIALIVVGNAGTAVAAPFTPGNLAIYRVGNGASISNAPEAVFIDEYTTTGSFVQSIPLPTESSGTTRALTTQGNASLEGLLNLSTDGQYLVLTGYDHNLGDAVPSDPGNGTLAQTTASQVPRTIGRVDFNGNVDTTTTYNDSGQGSPRSVISDNGGNFWIAQGSIGGGTDGGVRFTTLGSTGNSTSISQDSTDTRSMDLFGGQLYVSSFTDSRVMSVDVGAGTMTGLPGLPSGSGENTVQFFMADLGTEVAGVDTLYFADQRNAGNGGGLYKFSLSTGGTWLPTGAIAGDQGANAAVSLLRGLTGVVDELGAVTLYGTRNATMGGSIQSGQLLKFVDNTGYNGVLSGAAELLLTTASEEFTLFKGIDFVPAAAAEGLVGDYNGNNVVDAADYVLWRKSLATQDPLANDPLGLPIDQDQYDQWRATFGDASGAGSGLSIVSAIPEPGTLGLILIAGAALAASGMRNG